MLTNFFELEPSDSLREFPDANTFVAHFNNSRTLRHAQLRPDTNIVRRTFRDLEFENVRFSHSNFLEVTFTRCKFRDCLFVGTTFEDTQFHSCRFDDCNTYKFKMGNVYIDPRTFHLARSYRKTHSNIGLETFQQFYKNAEETHQPAFAAEADVERRKWVRYQLWYTVKKEWRRGNWLGVIGTVGPIAVNKIFDLTARYGHGPIRFMFLSLLVFMFVALLTQRVWPQMGFSSLDVSFVDSVYYSMLLMTAMGFADMFPSTLFGKMFAVGCALFGISWLGLFTAILVKRVIR